MGAAPSAAAQHGAPTTGAQTPAPASAAGAPAEREHAGTHVATSSSAAIERAVGKVISISGYRELTLSGDSEYARSMQAQNGPSKRQPEEALDEPLAA